MSALIGWLAPEARVPSAELPIFENKSPPKPLVVPWTIYILGPYFNVAVDAIDPDTDFTLESNRKQLKKNY